MAICGIALGGNIGDTAEIFDAALRRLEDRAVSVIQTSRRLRTPPMGADAGNDFVNAAAVVETSLQPNELLTVLHEIEEALGRTRDVHWGPRSLDLDLLYHDQTVICTAGIVVPHPSFWYRRFVLEPLAEIAPDYQHPILNQNVSELYQQLKRRPLSFVVSGANVTESDLNEIERSLLNKFDSAVHLFVEGSEHDHRDALFAGIAVEQGTPDFGTRQPQHEPDRTIRLCCEKTEVRRTLLTALTDICGAVFG